MLFLKQYLFSLANYEINAYLVPEAVKGSYSLRFLNVAIGRINEVAALTGFSYTKIHECFDGTKKVAVIMR